MERLDRLLSNLGYCTRSQTRDFLRAHRVTSAGQLVRDPSSKVDHRQLTLDEGALDHPEGLLLMMNKPAGYLCSHDEGPRIYDLLPEQWMRRNPLPTSIGRLDKDATGLILITDCTALVHDLTSPKHHVDKIYEVVVDRPLDTGVIDLFRAGTLMLKGEQKPCLPAQLEIDSPTQARVTLQEGRYHQVKRMFAAAGYEVVRLHRTAMGEYRLADIKPGEWADLPIPEKYRLR